MSEEEKKKKSHSGLCVNVEPAEWETPFTSGRSGGKTRISVTQ